jgi:hypothetical protein
MTEILQKSILITVILFVSLIFITEHDAYALVTITWDAASHSLTDGEVGTGGTPTTSIFTVTDTSLASDGVVDKIIVLVNSTTFPSGITLTLTETGPNTGIFKNTILFLQTVQVHLEFQVHRQLEYTNLH